MGESQHLYLPDSKQASKTARIAASLFFFVGVPLSLWGQKYVLSKIFVTKDPAATADNLLSNEFLFRMSIASHLTDTIAFVLMMMLFYRLFRPVNKHLARLMITPILAQIPVVLILEILHYTALMILKSEPRASFNIAQQQVTVYFLLRTYGYGGGAGIGKLLIGLSFIPFGMLAYRSRFVPRVVGVLLLIGGIGYVADCFTAILLQRADYLIIRQYLMYTTVAYMLALLWFLIKGVNVEKTGVK